jgi:hypothetical protein
MAADIIPLLPAYGASPDDWAHFDLILGLTADLLPVVSNPRAVISPDSGLKEPGKTPSQYNVQRQVAGLAKWTQRRTTPADIARWQRERDYGICLQTRTVRALDNDLTDAVFAQRVEAFTAGALGLQLPKRCRANSAKFLQAFELPGDYTKRRIKTEHGVIEFLATGQQFVAVGTHPSGVRYEWEGGLPDAFPTLTPEQFEHLWTALEQEFGTEDAATSRPSTKHQRLADVHEHDPVARHLLDSGRVLKAERDGRLHITCPWEHEHTTQTGESATTYWPAHTGGYALGHFRCLHAHCEHRTDDEFQAAVGYAPTDEFRAIVDEVATPPGESSDEPKQSRFRVVLEDEFSRLPKRLWIVKGVLPRGDLAMVYGASGSGKSFWVIDLAAAIQLGHPWCGRKVAQGQVVYIAAEGAQGVRKRVAAYKLRHGVGSLPLGLIEAAPNLRRPADVQEVIAQIKATFGHVTLIIVDTLARVSPGAEENGGKDMGPVLEYCAAIGRATGATVLLVHHAGKEVDRGARGWSGLKAAMDVEIEINRADDARSATVTKMKDGEEGQEFGFTLETVPLGPDDDGDEITSCVVRHNAGGRVHTCTRGPKGAVEKEVMRVVEELTAEGPVHVSVVKAAAEGRIDRGEGRQDRRGYRVQRAIDSLIETGRLRMADGGRVERA